MSGNGYEPYSLYSRLKSLTGKAPQEFIRIIRLQQAAELLKQGKNVTEVATDTGFINVKYFSMLFKKQFGIQPANMSRTVQPHHQTSNKKFI